MRHVHAAAGAATYVMGSACLVLLGHLVGCFAQDFAPSPMLVEAYLSLLGMVTAAGHHEHCTLTPGDSFYFILLFITIISVINIINNVDFISFALRK